MGRTQSVVTLLAIVSLLTCTASAAPVNSELVCRPDTTTLTPHELLRSLSLDLRGVTPTMDEYTSVDEAAGIPPNLIGEWLESSEFRERAVRFHRSLLWHNLSNLRIFNVRTDLSQSGQNPMYRRRQSQFLRGNVGYNNVQCLDEPAEFTTEGAIILKAQLDGTNREGYVMVEPFWAPDTEVKVCALDAQEATHGVMGKACDSTDGHKDPGCGCGPNLMWCNSGGTGKVRAALAKDLDLRVEKILVEGRPWTDLLTDTPAFVNGPLVHYLRHQDKLHGGLSFRPHAVPKAQLPDIPYTEEDTWVEIKLSSDHAGILTSPAYLLRFQTNRARANKFYADFLCTPFVAPSGGLPPSTDEEALEPDLQKRPGCAWCHAGLEPAASYWGRWPESSASYLTPEAYPAFSQTCQDCALGMGSCDGCANYKTKALTTKEEGYFGHLETTVFLADKHMSHIDDGPRTLVYRSLVDDRLPSCMTRRVATWLFGRAPLAEEEPWLSEVSQAFVSSNYDFPALVQELATSDMYRNVR